VEQVIDEQFMGWPRISPTAPVQATAALLEEVIDEARSRGIDPGGSIHATEFGHVTLCLARRLDGYTWDWVAEAVCGASVGSRVETYDPFIAVSHWAQLHEHWRRHGR
jgi:uncharacterized membrane-anchored protein